MRRMTTRPALGPCVSFKLDEDTHLKLVNAKERSGRSKAGEVVLREGANKQVISSQADSLIKISRIWADFFPANTSNQPI